MNCLISPRRCDPIEFTFFRQGGQYLLTLVDHFCVSFLIYVMAIAELITFCWIYGIKRLCRDVEFMLGIKSNWYWRISWGIIAPVLMITIFVYELITMVPIQYNGYIYPDEFYGRVFRHSLLRSIVIYFLYISHLANSAWMDFVGAWNGSDSALDGSSNIQAERNNVAGQNRWRL